MTQPSQELYDPMQSGPSGPPQAPTVTLASVGRKNKLEGVIVPVLVGEQLKAYRVTQQRAYPSNDLLFFDDGKPRTQIVLTLLTSLRNWDYTTDSFKERLEEAEKNGDEVPTDVGLRRVVLKGGKPLNGAKDALRAAGVSNFEIGGVYGIQQNGKEKPVAGSESQPYILEHFYTKATEDSVAAANKAYADFIADKSTPDGDPMAEGDEPPF